jgi:hypothetical protein
MNTDTPRTDEVAWPETGLVEGDFARQLERELTAVTEQRDEAYAMLCRIARKGEFMDMEGQRLVVFDWLARRHISSENDKCDTPRTHNENKLATVTEQRDRLADIVKKIRAGYGGQLVDPDCDCSDCEFLRPIDEALQSLTPKDHE